VSAGNRRIDSPSDAKDLPNEPFKPVPELNTIEDRIEEICQHTIMTFFRIGVMVSVVARRLKEADSLQESDDRSVFGRRAMGPFVDLIRVRA